MLNILKSLIKDEKGQGMAEYGLILAVVAIVVIGGLTALAGGLNTNFNEVVSKL